jgi:hypothetical protein
MSSVLTSRRTGTAASVGAVLLLGMVGAALVVDIALLAMPTPGSPSGRAWRTVGLASMTTGLVVGGLSSVILVVLDANAYGVIYGMLLVVPGAVLGGLVGIVLGLDVYRREDRLL